MNVIELAYMNMHLVYWQCDLDHYRFDCENLISSHVILVHAVNEMIQCYQISIITYGSRSVCLFVTKLAATYLIVGWKQSVIRLLVAILKNETGEFLEKALFKSCGDICWSSWTPNV